MQVAAPSAAHVRLHRLEWRVQNTVRRVRIQCLERRVRLHRLERRVQNTLRRVRV